MLKKKLEIKHLEDQLSAMDLLDNLQEKADDKMLFAAINDQIEKAKQLFKMRIDQDKRDSNGLAQENQSHNRSISSYSGDSPKSMESDSELEAGRIDEEPIAKSS